MLFNLKNIIMCTYKIEVNYNTKIFRNKVSYPCRHTYFVIIDLNQHVYFITNVF